MLWFFNCSDLMTQPIIFRQVSIVNVAMICVSVITVETELEELLTKPDEYADFSFLGFW